MKRGRGWKMTVEEGLNERRGWILLEKRSEATMVREFACLPLDRNRGSIDKRFRLVSDSLCFASFLSSLSFSLSFFLSSRIGESLKFRLLIILCRVLHSVASAEEFCIKDRVDNLRNCCCLMQN